MYISNHFTLVRKISNGILICLAAILLGCGGGGGQEAAKPILIKFPHVTAPATPKGEAAERFKQVVEERLAGRVAVEVYPSAQLMSDDDSLDALAFGEVQMIAISLSKLDRLTHKFQIFDLPFLFPDLPAVERFQASDYGQGLLRSMVDSKLLGLSFWHNGMKQFSGPAPMRTPESAKGLKFRIMESDVLQAQILQIGGNPQKMAFAEVYQALQTGAVDAQENTWSNIYSSKFYEVQPYITETNHGYLGYLVAVNPDFWASLPDDIRSELALIVQEVTIWANEQSTIIDLAGKEKIIESGQSEVIELTADERAAWQRAMRPVWDTFSESIGADLIAAAQAYDK
ncbi:MAG: DctP family TRAP transporter solute-binding subunit [Woeseiaceae bacterium]|nr:DctP family TRAP transporter solute-binding subunit [Woeseiaceae bacterium]